MGGGVLCFSRQIDKRGYQDFVEFVQLWSPGCRFYASSQAPFSCTVGKSICFGAAVVLIEGRQLVGGQCATIGERGNM